LHIYVLQALPSSIPTSGWQKTAPTAGEPLSKSVGTHIFHWCATCKSWSTTHGTVANGTIPGHIGKAAAVPGAEESGDVFAVLRAELPKYILVFLIFGSAIAAGIGGLLVSATASWLGVFQLYEVAVFLLIYCATAGILAGKLAVAAFLAALRLDEKTKDVFVKLKEYEDSSPVWFFASRVPVTPGNNTGRQAGESEDTLALLSDFIRFRVATCSTITAGASLLVSTTVTWLCVSGAFFSFYCANAGIFVGFVVGAVVARWVVANLFSTLNRDKAAIVANANAAKQAKDARREGRVKMKYKRRGNLHFNNF
jgi:uncharacterized membrane protein